MEWSEQRRSHWRPVVTDVSSYPVVIEDSYLCNLNRQKCLVTCKLPKPLRWAPELTLARISIYGIYSRGNQAIVHATISDAFIW